MGDTPPASASLGPPALAPASPPPPSGPPPLEGGPPPLEEPAAPLPPGLSAKPKAPASVPPPLEPAPPPPPPLSPAGPAFNGGGSASASTAATPEPSASPEEIRAAILDWLRKKPGSKGLLNQLGVYLRSRRLAPEGQLKRFLQQHCQGRVVVHETKSGTDVAQLAEVAVQERTAALERERAAAAAAASTPAPAEAKRPTSAGDNFDPAWLEQQLMQYCVQLQRAGQQPSMPSLGTFCIEKLGLQMKGRLKPFLDRRPALCSVSDDGRQHVHLTPAGIILGGGTPGADGAAAPLPNPLASVGAARVPGAAAGAGSSSSGMQQQQGGPSAAAASTEQVAAAVMPGVAAAQSAAQDYKRWDYLTKEIYGFVRSQGVATFNQIDAHVKAHPGCIKQIALTGVPLPQWRSQFFLHKRRNIFRMQGPVVSPLNYVPDQDDTGSELSAAPSASAEDFPPLPGSASAAAAPAAAGNGLTSGGEGANPGPAAAPAAASAGPNPLLAAFAAERQALEQLRDDVQAKLASFRALSELQKENAGLRAACVTLGRELLSLKTEFMAFQQQTMSSLAALSSGAVALPAPAGAPAAAAGEPGAAAAATAQQQQVLQQPRQLSGELAPALAVSGSTTPTAAQAAEAAAAAQAALPLHMPATAPLVAAPAPPSMPMPGGEVVLVGGHDGGTWLDSVDYFSPSDCLWASLPLLGKPRSFAAAVATTSEVFVAGGGNGVDWYDSVVRFDRQAGLMGGWTELAPLQVARGSLAAGISGGYLFVYGGGKPKEQYNVVEWYDPQSNRWLPGPSLQRKRFALGGAALVGAIYAVGGFDGTSYLACAERLDPRTDHWELLPGGMATKRGGHAVAAAGGCLYALGGFDGAQAIPHCEVFEPRTSTWRPIADMCDARAYGSCASLGSTVFAVGGLQSDMQTHALLFEAYNPAADAWEHVELPPNANPRRSFLAACGLE
ncbi:hypothetical protein ABPG75_000684 [Micractinium tetrahymenae]